MQKVYLVSFADTRLGIVIANEVIHNFNLAHIAYCYTCHCEHKRMK